MSAKQRVRQLIQSREKSAAERFLPELAGKSCSSAHSDKTDHQKAHCEFELRHKLAARTTSLPNIDISQSNKLVKCSKLQTSATGSRESKDGIAVKGTGKTYHPSGVMSHAELTRLRSLENMDPEIRDNMNVVMINFIRQARINIEKSKENRNKLETELSNYKSKSLSVKKIGKCVDITMRPKALTSSQQPHSEVKGRLIKSRWEKCYSKNPPNTSSIETYIL